MRSVRHSVETDRSAQQSTDFENLVKSHYTVVYNLAYRVLRRREDAEDVAQQTFARALPRLGDLRHPAAAGRWLCRITANLCVDELRRRSSQGNAAEIDGAALDDLADEDVLRIPMAAAELHETRLRVWRAALALPPRQRLALALRESHQMSYVEIAAAMGTISVAAVETLLFRARAGFRLAYTGRKPPGPRGAECEWITERLSASIDFELSHRDALRIDVHLPHCDACRFVSQELRATSPLYALLPLIAPLPGAEAAVLIAVSSAGAGLSGAPAMGAGGGLSAGLGTGVRKRRGRNGHDGGGVGDRGLRVDRQCRPRGVRRGCSDRAGHNASVHSAGSDAHGRGGAGPRDAPGAGRPGLADAVHGAGPATDHRAAHQTDGRRR